MIIKEKELKEDALPVNKIICGSALSVLRKLPDSSVDCVVTSPPYYSKRDYGEEACTIWGGDPNCEHEWTDELIVRTRGVAGVGNTGNHSKIIPGQGTHQSHGRFCKKCGAWYGQLGLEPTPQMFIDHLIEVFKEIKRILKPHGNVFVVIDDTYSQGGKGVGSKDPKYPKGRDNEGKILPHREKNFSLPQKTVCLVPELFAIRMVYDLGFILRNKIIWAKKVHIYKEKTTIGNAMPESVKDRLCHTYEVVYHFVKEPKYYYDLNAVRIPVKDETVGRMQRAKKLIERTGLPITPNNKYYQAIIEGSINKYGQAGILTGRFLAKHEIAVDRVGNFNYTDTLHTKDCHPLGANPGDVLQINTEPLPEAHFATFPERLVEFLIKVGCPEQVCKKCGKPYQAVYDRVEVNVDWRYYGAEENGKYHGQAIKDYESAKAQNPSEVKRRILKSLRIGRVFSGYKPSCGCGAGFESGIVFDPFLGSGTTALVALKHGRRFIGIEIKKEYCEIAYKRIKPYINQYKLYEFL